MQLQVFVVDDKLEELEKAHAALQAAGMWNVSFFDSLAHRAHAHMGYMGEGGTNIHELANIFERMDAFKSIMDGIITDLMFDPGKLSQLKDDPQEFPAGMGIVIWAVKNGIPVVVCTDADLHKGMAQWAITTLEVLGVPVQRHKDWKSAVAQLAKVTTK